MPSNFDLVTTSVDYIGLTLSGYPHVVSYSSIDMLPGIPHIDQLEIERLFDTGTKTGNTVFTIADRRKMFKLPKNWYTINETTKQISILQFSTIANANVTFNLTTGLGLKYYAIDDANTSVVIPNLGANDTIIIRRKTLSEEKIVNFTAGSRLTSGQLNLSSNQLINIIQELLWKVDNEVIIKYDKDAIDGPFLGTFNGAFVDVTGNIDMNGQRVTNLGYSGTLDDAMPKKEITDTVFRHGVITKDTTPTNSPGAQNDIIEGNANEGRSGVWFNPQDGKLRAWAGNNWVIVTNAINPAVNPFLVQTNTAQSLSGQKTFLAPTTFDSTVTMTSNLAVNTNTLLVNTANNRVGINISNPPNSLSVKARNDTTDGFYMDGLSPGPVNTWINLIPNASSGTYNPLTQAGDRLFAFGTTAANQTTSVGLTIAPWSTNAVGLRMAGNGNIGIGTNNPSTTLEVNGTLNVTGAATLSNTLNVTGNTTTPTAVVNAVKFPAVQVASADVNTLDDYEEGTWVPTLLIGGSSNGITYNSLQGSYVKIGCLVYIEGRILLSSKGSNTGTVSISGLPFVQIGPTVHQGLAGNHASFTSSYYAGCAATIASCPTGYFTSTGITLVRSGTGAVYGVTNGDINNDFDLIFSAFYRTNT